MKTIRVKVKPQSRESSLQEAGDGTWIARVKSPPVDGKANAELAELVAGGAQAQDRARVALGDAS